MLNCSPAARSRAPWSICTRASHRDSIISTCLPDETPIATPRRRRESRPKIPHRQTSSTARVGGELRLLSWPAVGGEVGVLAGRRFCRLITARYSTPSGAGQAVLRPPNSPQATPPCR